MRMSQKDRVKAHFLHQGYVDNYWCWNVRLTNRLGAIMHILKNEGLEFKTYFGHELRNVGILNRKNFYYCKPKSVVDGILDKSLEVVNTQN